MNPKSKKTGGGNGGLFRFLYYFQIKRRKKSRYSAGRKKPKKKTALGFRLINNPERGSVNAASWTSYFSYLFTIYSCLALHAPFFFAGLLRETGGLYSGPLRPPLLLPRLRRPVRAVPRVPRRRGAEDKGHQRLTGEGSGGEYRGGYCYHKQSIPTVGCGWLPFYGWVAILEGSYGWLTFLWLFFFYYIR